MAERRVAVASPDGLHARPAAQFVKAATETGIAVTIARPGADTRADARSILAVLSLDVRQGDEVVLQADGDGADSALSRLAALLGDARD
jgi:phosphocarrier protein